MTPHRRRPAPSRRAGKTGNNSVEWIGGEVTMPAYVSGEGDPYRPGALLWMVAGGPIVGLNIARPGELLPQASESLQGAMEHPMEGPPHRPSRVRVASAELAAALRAGHPGLEVVCAPTPELDELLGELREHLAGAGEIEQSYLSPGVTSEAMAAFFRAAAGLFRAAPWTLVPDALSLFRVTVEQLGVRDQALSVIGRAGQSYGLVLFSDLDDFEAFLDGAELLELGGEPEMPPHLALNFEHGADLAPELRREVDAHGWEVAGADAYPWLVAVDGDLVARPPTGSELTTAEAIALALTAVSDDREALENAWQGDEPLSRTLSVTTHGGDVEVTLHAPHGRAPAALEPSEDLLADLAALSLTGEEADEAARAALEDELVDRFAVSPEGQDLEDVGACRLVMDLGATYVGETVATLDAGDLREVLFELIPRKVSIDPSEAGWIVATTRAFYNFLKRELGLPQADACLRVLGKNATRRLEAALSDSSKFGMAKSLVMAGADAGYDMRSEEGFEAWMQAVRGSPLPPSIPLPDLPEPSSRRKARKADKAKRKAARKARKKNR